MLWKIVTFNLGLKCLTNRVENWLYTTTQIIRQTQTSPVELWGAGTSCAGGSQVEIAIRLQNDYGNVYWLN